MPADTPDPDQPTDSGVEAVATDDPARDGDVEPDMLGDRFCSRPGCEFVDQQHMHVHQLPHGWNLDSGDAVPVVLDQNPEATP